MSLDSSHCYLSSPPPHRAQEHQALQTLVSSCKQIKITKFCVQLGGFHSWYGGRVIRWAWCIQFLCHNKKTMFYKFSFSLFKEYMLMVCVFLGRIVIGFGWIVSSLDFLQVLLKMNFVVKYFCQQYNLNRVLNSLIYI